MDENPLVSAHKDASSNFSEAPKNNPQKKPRISVGEITQCIQLLRQNVDRAVEEPDEAAEALKDLWGRIRSLKTPGPEIPLLGAYRDYLQDLGWMGWDDELSDTEIELRLDPEETSDWQGLFSRNPATTVFAKHIYDHHYRPENPFFDKHPLPSRFPRMFENACEAQQLIASFFDDWRKLLDANHEMNEVSVRFLSAWQQDVERLIAEALNMGCCLAVKGQKSESFSYVGAVHAPLSRKQRLGSRIRDLHEEIGTLNPEFNSIDPSLQGSVSNPTRSSTFIPASINLDDIMDFLNDMKHIWTDISRDFKTPIQQFSDHFFGTGHIALLARPKYDRKADSRVRIKHVPIRPKSRGEFFSSKQDPKSCSFRLDKDEKRKRIAFEFCSIRTPQILALSEADFLDKPSINLNLNEQRALCAAIVAQASQRMFPLQSISHHFQGSADTEEFYENFDDIVDCLCDGLITSSLR